MVRSQSIVDVGVLSLAWSLELEVRLDIILVVALQIWNLDHV